MPFCTLARIVLSLSCLFVFGGQGLAADKSTGKQELGDAATKLSWKKTPEGWRLDTVTARQGRKEVAFGIPSGHYGLLYSAVEPSKSPQPISWQGHPEGFPEPGYKYLIKKWEEARTEVALNTAGEVRTFYPSSAHRVGEKITFQHEDDLAVISADWSLDPKHPGDIQVTLTLTAKKSGWYSLPTPTLASLPRERLAWATIPGVLQGTAFESDFVRAYAYGQGLPERPVIVREATASSPLSLVSNKQGITLATIAEPGTATDPWEYDKNSRPKWKLGLSHLNRAGELSPTLYHPVLGESGSELKPGESRTFRFRYTLRSADWFSVYKHVVYDIYRFGQTLDLKKAATSLTDRVLALHRYTTDDWTSLWRTERFEGVTLGAQAYNGGVVGADKDAMKNSDYGAMWMLAHLTGDPRLTHDRLPYARNFKLVQQQSTPGFFQGAAIGQYYLSKSHRFVEEWGSYVEPIALTYYTLLDLGNILLFQPDDQELRERFKLGAEKLLTWQKRDGSWEVAYDRATEQPVFTDLRDYRPTFYGLLVAYRVLGDKKYLEAAKRGADWLIREAIDPGRFLGVCGDVRFVPDFGTAQIAGGLLDLHEVTRDKRYLQAAVHVAKFYTLSIYTHPISSNEERRVNGVKRAQWEINQAGLSFEHGGLIGSATNSGPILLASHAGLFIRLAALTGEPLFRDMARAAALARDAFVDPTTHVASYYWNAMNRGAGPFPHHAWWQIGWITDYLIAEASLRSGGDISFPRGFMTPKVGPHSSFGFAAGTVFDQPARLRITDGLVTTRSASIDYLTAEATRGRRLFIILLNNQPRPATSEVSVDLSKLALDEPAVVTKAFHRDAQGRTQALFQDMRSWSIPLDPFGFAVVQVDHGAAP